MAARAAKRANWGDGRTENKFAVTTTDPLKRNNGFQPKIKVKVQIKDNAREEESADDAGRKSNNCVHAAIH